MSKAVRFLLAGIALMACRTATAQQSPIDAAPKVLVAASRMDLPAGLGQTALNAQVARDLAVMQAYEKASGGGKALMMALPPGDWPTLRVARLGASAEARARIDGDLAPYLKLTGPALAAQAQADRADWNQKELAAFNARFTTNRPDWLPAAQKALTDLLGPNPAPAAVSDQLTKLYEAGCRDPIVLFYLWQTRGDLEDPQATAEEYLAAIAAMDKLSYPDYVKFHFNVRVLGMVARNMAPTKADRADPDAANRFGANRSVAASTLLIEKVQLPAAAQHVGTGWLLAEDVPLLVEIDKARTHSYTEARDDMLTGWIAKNPSCPLVYRIDGQTCLKAGWDVLGPGSLMINAQMRTDFNTCMRGAEFAFRTAVLIDPGDEVSATEVLTADIALHPDRSVIDADYKRAMDVDSDNLAAVTRMLMYLRPEWYGSPEAMLDFAKKVAAAHEPGAKCALAVVIAHEFLADTAVFAGRSRQAYFADAKVKDEINTALTAYLNANPKDQRVRYHLLRYACMTGAWDVASAALKDIGTSLDANPPAGFLYFKAIAASGKWPGSFFDGYQFSAWKINNDGGFEPSTSVVRDMYQGGSVFFIPEL